MLVFVQLLKSFGRIWQYYVSWSDFGFARRALVGTVLTETSINKIFSNQYLFAYAIYSILLAICYALFVFTISKIDKIYHNKILLLCIFFSPAIFSHFAYSTGTQDLVLVLIFFVSIFYAKNNIIFSLMIITGILTHELFVFLLPNIFLIRYRNTYIFHHSLITPIAITLLTILMVVLFGRLHVDQATYETIMRERMPTAEYQHSLWSGYVELGRTTERNLSGYSVFAELWRAKYYAIIPTIYALLIAGIVSFFLKMKLIYRIALFLSIIFPIFTIIIATDYYRWISLSGCLGLIAAIYFIKHDLLEIPRQMLLVILAFSLFAPFGAAQYNWPFPLHQFLIHKFVGS